jgi:hypothetical protein
MHAIAKITFRDGRENAMDAARCFGRVSRPVDAGRLMVPDLPGNGRLLRLARP